MKRRDQTPCSYYICNPFKNVKCKKSCCYYTKSGDCFLTSNPNYTDQDVEHPVAEDEGWKTTPEIREMGRNYRKEMAQSGQTIQYRKETDGEASQGAE